MIIRKYQHTDFDQMIKLHREVLKKDNVYRGDGVWERDLWNIEDHYFKRNGALIVGIENIELIAMGALRKIDDCTAEIARMRVRPDYQGKGLGFRILSELEKIALANQYSELILETDERLMNAIKLYTRNGYILWKEEMLDGYKCIWYKKKIV